MDTQTTKEVKTLLMVMSINDTAAEFGKLKSAFNKSVYSVNKLKRAFHAAKVADRKRKAKE